MGLTNRKPADEITFLDQAAQDLIAAISDSLPKQVDIDGALTQVLLQVTEFIGAEEASVFLVDAAKDELVLSYACGTVGKQIIGLRLQYGQGVVGWVIKHSEDLIVPYPGLDARFFKGVDKRTGFTTRSILCGPISVDGRAVGAIEVMNKIEGTFNDDDLVLLRAIARIVARVIPTFV